MLAQAHHSRPSPLPLPAALLADDLGPVVMADDPCEAAFGSADPTGPRKYYRARYYDPKIGRFISEDPLRFAGGANFYAYVENQPTNAVDPTGLKATLRCELIDPTHHPFLHRWTLRLSRARHCFIEVECEGRWATYLELWGQFAPAHPNGRPMMGPPNADRNAKSTSAPINPPPSTPTCGGCKFEEELIAAFNRLGGQLPPYRGEGPNSNSFVRRIIQAAGGTTTPPSTAYGWEK